MLKGLLLSSALLFTLVLSAQTFKVDGTIVDADDHSTLVSAVVKLISAADTTKWNGAMADDNGTFEFTDVTNGNYYLQISYIGYNNFKRNVTVSNADQHLGQVLMPKNATVLKDVEIVAQENRVQQKADTTEYNAGAYKTNPDANTEDLVTKMPGITSENGTIKAHGEDVKKVTVDGKEFFGDDVNLALKNLPADVVDKVQVFDRMSDQSQFTGFDDGNSQKTINIVTKRGKNNGVFGKIYGGYGYIDDSRYSAGAIINWFNGDRRLSFLGMSNNVNLQNFSTQDLLGVTGGSAPRGGGGPGGGGRPGGGGAGGNQGSSGVSNFLVGQQTGISTTHSAGLNYSDNWGKKVKVTASYFFNYADNVSSSTHLNRQYFISGDSSTFYTENNSNESKNQNHRINFRLEYSPDSMNKLIFTPKFSYQKNEQLNNIAGQNSINQEEIQSQSQSNYTSNNSGYNTSGDLLFQHKFKKRSRTFSIDIAGTVNNKSGNTTLNSQTLYSDQPDSALLDQQGVTSNKSYTGSASLSYTEPVGQTGMLQFNYNPSYTWNKSDKETNNFDSIVHAYDQLDTVLSNKFDNTYLVHKGGISYRVTDKRKLLSLMFGVNGQYSTLTGQEVYPYAYDINRNFFNVLPTVMINYKFSEKSNIRIFYRTSTTPPSIAQMQNVIDNSNPLLLSTGNPDLKQSYSHNAFVRYGYSNTKKAQSFFAFASINYTQNYVGNSTIIAVQDTMLNNEVTLHAGSQLTRPVNLDGLVKVSSFLTYGLPINKIKCNLNLNAGFSYSRTPSLINGVENISNTYIPTAGFVLGSNISEKVDFTLSYSANYNIVKNSLQKNSDNNYFTHNANLKFNWLFWKGFVFNTSLQNTYYGGVSQGYNQDIFLWNASLGYKFLKDQSLEVKAGVTDILNQNNGISRTVTETYVEDSKTQVLKRYLMLTVTYNLKFFKKQAGPPKP